MIQEKVLSLVNVTRFIGTVAFLLCDVHKMESNIKRCQRIAGYGGEQNGQAQEVRHGKSVPSRSVPFFLISLLISLHLFKTRD